MAGVHGVLLIKVVFNRGGNRVVAAVDGALFGSGGTLRHGGTIGGELLGHLVVELALSGELGGKGILLVQEKLDLLSLAFAGVVGSESVTLDTLDAALLLLVVGLGPLARREVGLGLGEDLSPRLSLLDRLHVADGTAGRRGGRRRLGESLEVFHLDGGGRELVVGHGGRGVHRDGVEHVLCEEEGRWEVGVHGVCESGCCCDGRR